MCSRCQRKKSVPLHAWGTLHFISVKPERLYKILKHKQLYVDVSIENVLECKSPSSTKNLKKTSILYHFKRNDVVSKKHFFFSCKRQARQGFKKRKCKRQSRLVKSCDVQQKYLFNFLVKISEFFTFICAALQGLKDKGVSIRNLSHQLLYGIKLALTFPPSFKGPEFCSRKMSMEYRIQPGQLLGYNHEKILKIDLMYPAVSAIPAIPHTNVGKDDQTTPIDYIDTNLSKSFF